MKPTAIAAVLAGALVFPAAPATSQEQALALRAGHSIAVPARDLVRVAVGDNKVAGVVPIGNSQVILNAKAPGHTTILIWTKKAFRSYDVTVTEESIDALAGVIRSTLAYPRVTVTPFEASVIVKGTVNDDLEYAALSQTLNRFDKTATAAKISIVNAVAIEHPLGDLQNTVAAETGVKDVGIVRDDKGNLIVSGSAANRTGAEKILARVRAQAGGYLAAEGKIIDRIAVASNSQVDVKVYVLEVDETALNQLGVRLQNATVSNIDPNTGLTTYVLGDPSFSGIESSSTGNGGKPFSGPGIAGRALNIGAFFRLNLLAPTLDLILRSGHARILSSPDLVTTPGAPATFLVGGEIPIPVPQALGQTTITYKEFGVKLNVTPNILGNGAVRTLVAPEVSDLDFQDGIQLNGFTIPAIKTSRLATDVVTNPGESVVLGGMLRRMEQRSIDKIPLLGDIPILGKLFRSTRYQKAETDVVFVLTPEIVER